jgi:predicted nuclease of restriction endonuclease-like (RecB) superfamily
MELLQHFEEIRQLIRKGRNKALQLAYAEQMKVYWQVGAYVNEQLSVARWGEKVVARLAAWLTEKEPGLKGFDRRNLYRMQEFYLTWHPDKIAGIWARLPKIVGSVSPQLQETDNQGVEIVGSVSPQFAEIPEILTKVSWSHHLVLLYKTKTIEEKLFYILLTIKENYPVRDLKRQISSGLYERQQLSQKNLTPFNHPHGDMIHDHFRDHYIFEFLDLKEPYNESDLQKALLLNLKQFIQELGRDFIFIGEEFQVKVGMQDFFIDLLFFHRELQSLVAFELKIDNFKPEYLGKMNFYLEALDRDVKKKHEKPSIGVLLCKTKDKEVVKYALSRSLSPALVAEYETKLPDKQLLERLLHEWSNQMDDD